MMGIYKFTNKINGKSYIGQSINLEQRFYDHTHRYKTPSGKDKHPKFYRALLKYELDNFSYEILEQADFFTKEELNEKEKYYIGKYDSYQNGYNMNEGGGFTGSNAKITADEVLEIKELLINSSQTFKEIGEKYNISEGTVRHINEGTAWSHIGLNNFPLRNKENIYKSSFRGERNGRAKWTNEEVLKLRELYVNHTVPEIYAQYKDRVTSPSAIKKVIMGTTGHFEFLPIYKKREKKWYLNGTCIDYPLGWNAGE